MLPLLERPVQGFYTERVKEEEKGQPHHFKPFGYEAVLQLLP